MIEKLTSIDPEKSFEAMLHWLFENVLNFNTLYQGVVIIAATIFSYIVFKIFKKRTRKTIENSTLSMRYKRIAYNIHKLFLPAIILCTIVIMQRILQSEMVGMNVWLIDGITKALLAWIGIRVTAQLIQNSTVRNILSTCIWIAAALSIFGIIDETTQLLQDISFNFGTFHISLFMIVTGAFYLFVLVYFAFFLTAIADRKISQSKTLARSSKLLFTKIVRIVLITLALTIGLISSGVDLSLFAVLGGAIGLGVGLGLQRSISNLFSGMLLLFDRSIEPGDIIELPNGTFGWVVTMSGRHTEIQTGDNKTHLIPNEELVTQRVINWSHGDTKISVSVDFGVHYKSDPHEVIKIAIAAAAKPARVLKDPAPSCFITAFGDNAINFSLGFWINDAQNGLKNIKGEVLLALWDALKKSNIEIPYPHREIYMHNVDIPAPKL